MAHIFLHNLADISHIPFRLLLKLIEAKEITTAVTTQEYKEAKP